MGREKCDKCGSGSCNKGALYAHVWPPVFLCGFCHNTYQSLNDKLFDAFMADDCQNKPPIENWLSEVSGNMLHARMERKAGKSKWVNAYHT